jgi:malonyl CoA-acyl carrier protein transacylase
MSSIQSGRANVLAVFGGQGNVEDYFDELVLLFTTYRSLSTQFMSFAALTLLTHSTSEEAKKAHATAINVMSWLEKPETRPNLEKLLATDLSLPLIGLTQLLSYWIMLKVLDKTPGEMRGLIAGE